MIIGIENELRIFALAILTGNFLCMLYIAISVMRKLISHNNLWISLEDLIYWGFVSGYVFVQIQETSSGNIRWYFVVGLLGGSITTYYFIRKIMAKCIDKSDKRE